MNQKGNGAIEFVATIAIVVVILVGVGIWNLVAGYVGCKSYENITDRDTKYSLITGCYVKTPQGAWVPREEMTKSSVVESK
ncbi:hypothetical protein Acj9p104 [Acinetobacter phage Acj9]|uniref:Uncharacterized protein n=1 Tax=Acinetobacter phage Acj9 TaxID=760939 RepID=E5EPN8_9CAUD|nr:hypothetical protein Acj9p104 [Acinetobacter phage Acj9]ADG60004.1 hypothetical protein Acj9p104 [Acinetobacter phage Acj9]